MIPYGRQDVTEADIQAVVDVLRSDFLTQGPVVPRFENAIASYCGVAYGVAANSATSALHIACLALGLGPGDWLWTSPITFVASGNCGLYCGARVDFVDIDPVTWNMDPLALAAKLEVAEREGRLPKIVVPVHLCGEPCDMRAIKSLAQKYGFHIIEDASHAIGGCYGGQPIGRCTFGDITVFSFHPVKIITSAEGGMAMTADAELAERMAMFRSHGITRDAGRMTRAPEGAWYYQQLELGYNYRLTELQAALGLSQSVRIDENVELRHRRAAVYDQALAELPLTLPSRSVDARSAFHLYAVRIGQGNRDRVFSALRRAGVGVNLHYIPVHLQPYYTNLGFARGAFPRAESYYEEAISLPLYPRLSEEDQLHVIATLSRELCQ